MVCIIDIIKKIRKNVFTKNGLDIIFYKFYNKLDFELIKFPEDTAPYIAMSGYMGDVDKDFQLEKIDSFQKQNNYRDNFFQCIGILLYTKANKTVIIEEFNRFDLKRKYIMSKIFPELNSNLRHILDNGNDYVSKFLKLLIKKETNIEEINKIEYEYLLEDNSDIVDLIILEDYIKFYKLTTVNIMEVKDIIINILENFSNSIKWITQNRRKDRKIFEIKDEYDVQDLLCTIIQSSFPECEKEDPGKKDAQGLSHRIDLVLHSYGIYIEVKMIKYGEKQKIQQFKKQINEDIVGYSANKDLKHLIFFTYDPYKYADNENYFKCRDIMTANNGITYSIDKIYQK